MTASISPSESIDSLSSSSSSPLSFDESSFELIVLDAGLAADWVLDDAFPTLGLDLDDEAMAVVEGMMNEGAEVR